MRLAHHAERIVAVLGVAHRDQLELGVLAEVGHRVQETAPHQRGFVSDQHHAVVFQTDVVREADKRAADFARHADDAVTEVLRLGIFIRTGQDESTFNHAPRQPFAPFLGLVVKLLDRTPDTQLETLTRR